jgi:hypothetical protein
MTFKEFVREFSTGCLGHFFIAVAAAALLGIGAHHFYHDWRHLRSLWL